MGNTCIQHSDRFDADIEYSLADLLNSTAEDQDTTVYIWGLDDDGYSYFLAFTDGAYDDTLTYEA